MEQMLDELCGELRNFFEVKPDGIHSDTFTIQDGGLQVDFLQTGQYFRIKGSVFNDGVYKYPANGLVDESFTGQVWAMAVPPAVIALCDDIQAWNEKYGDITGVNYSPFQSESFNNYSYSKRSGSYGSSNASASPMTWKDAFSKKLTRWRKL